VQLTTLRIGQELWIGDVRVCYGGRKRRGQACLAIDAPPGVSVRRGELAGRPRIQEGPAGTTPAGEGSGKTP